MPGVGRWAVVAVLLSACAAGAAQTEPPALQALRRALPGYHAYKLVLEESEIGPWIPFLTPSPDGKWLLAIHLQPRGAVAGVPTTLGLYTAKGEFVRDLTHERFRYVESFAWSQTSDAVFFRTYPLEEASERQGGIWKLDLKTGAFLRPKWPWMPAGGLPIWSPVDDSYLAVDRLTNEWERWDRVTLYRVWMRSGARRKLLEETMNRGGYSTTLLPVWSPDGREIAFATWEATAISIGGSEIRYLRGDWWIMASDGSRRRSLLPSRDLDRAQAEHGWKQAEGYVGPPCWVAGGSQMLVNGQAWTEEAKTVAGIWLIDLARGKAEWAASEVVLVSGSQDGTHLYVRVKNEDQWEYYLLASEVSG